MKNRSLMGKGTAVGQACYGGSAGPRFNQLQVPQDQGPESDPNLAVVSAEPLACPVRLL